MAKLLNKVIATIPYSVHGVHTPQYLYLNPDGRVLYVLSVGSSSIGEIDTQNAYATVWTGYAVYPTAIVINSTSTRVYISGGGLLSIKSCLGVSPSYSKLLSTGDGIQNAPQTLAITPDNTKVYIGNYASNITVVSTLTDTVIETISISLIFNASDMLITPNGLYLYTSHLSNNVVTVVSVLNDTHIATIAVGLTPSRLIINPAGTRVYVLNRNANTVSVIDTNTNTVIATVFVGSGVIEDLVITNDGLYVYVTNPNTNTVSVISTTTNTVISTIEVGFYPSSVAITPDSLYVYVLNYLQNTVSIISTLTNTLVGSVIVGSYPSDIVINSSGNRVYVVNYGSESISVLGFGIVPPLRQRHRDDGLSTDAKQQKGSGSSQQSSLRRGGRVYY